MVGGNDKPWNWGFDSFWIKKREKMDLYNGWTIISFFSQWEDKSSIEFELFWFLYSFLGYSHSFEQVSENGCFSFLNFFFGGFFYCRVWQLWVPNRVLKKRKRILMGAVEGWSEGIIEKRKKKKGYFLSLFFLEGIKKIINSFCNPIA